jgi:hypothetical protein
MAVPYTFGSATTSIPLSQLDSNFATTITLGNTAVQLGNTITTLTGVTNLASSGALTLGSNGNTTAVTIDTGQRTTFPTTIAVGGATPSTSGSGISFPATQSASSDANTLDDYEEGTFTPAIYGTSTAGTGTYSRQTGTYTKIGNRVYFSIYIIWSAHTGTGDMNINGLPFTSNSSNFSPCALRLNNLTLTSLNVLSPWVVDNTATVSLQQYPTGGGTSNAVAMDTSAELSVSGHYFV